MSLSYTVVRKRPHLHDLLANLGTVCDKKVTSITFLCFELISIQHNIIVALK